MQKYTEVPAMELRVGLVLVNEAIDKVFSDGKVPSRIEKALVAIQGDIDALTNNDRFKCPNCHKIVQHAEDNPENCKRCGASFNNDGRDICPKCLMPDNDCTCKHQEEYI